MLSYAVFSGIHYVGFMFLFAALVAQHLALNDAPGKRRRRRIHHLNGIALGMWVLSLGTGLILWLVVLSVESYARNGLFHWKLLLFSLLLPGLGAGWFHERIESRFPSAMKWITRATLTLLVLIPLLASFMRRGF